MKILSVAIGGVICNGFCLSFVERFHGFCRRCARRLVSKKICMSKEISNASVKS